MARPRPYLHRSPPLTSSGALPTHLEDGQPLIRLQTLGASTILVGEERVNASAGTLFCLLLRLLHAPGMLLGRDVLLTSLWPGQPESRQRANLRQALYKLRNTGVRASMHGDVVQLDSAQVLRTFSLERSSETFARDVTLGHEPFGAFLPGFVVPWPEQQEWITEQRESIHAEIRRVLVEQLRHRRDRADWGGADPLARWLLVFDPLNEEATLTLADCAFLSGSKSSALGIIDKYLEELGPTAGDIRLPAMMLRRRIAEPPARGRISFAPTERHFVGREEELAALTLAMRRARWHDGGAMLIHGTAGIGKSRLAHELEKVATIEGVSIAHTACREGDVHRSLSVWIDVLPELLSMPGALGAAPESLAALRRIVPSERGEGGEEDREAQPVPPLLRRSMLDLLAALADEKPQLLVIDDVHWMDEHSWELLSDLIERVGCLRIFVVLTSRQPHARPTRPARIPMALRTLSLPSLSREQCVQLSRAIGADLSAHVTEDLAEWFVRASEGIPLFLRALVNHWIETGEAGGVPPTLEGAIEQRICQLSADSLRVMQTAVMLGRWATVDRVVAVLELRANEMLTCIEQIEALGASDSREGRILSVHELLGRSALARMSTLASRTLLTRAAAILYAHAVESNDTEMLIASLDAFHEAGDDEKLRQFTLRHLEQIVEFGSPVEGVEALRRIEYSNLAAHEKARVKDAVAKLLVQGGSYARVFGESLGGSSLPELSPSLSDAEANRALSFVDSSYRADRLVDRSRLIEFTQGVVELYTLGRETRVRAGDIGLVIVSNECDSERARAMFDALSITEQDLQFDDVCKRIAVVFHTHFGDHELAARLAHSLLDQAKTMRAAPAAYQHAMRAGFALRIVEDSRVHLDALRLAEAVAKQAHTPFHQLNATWLLAQSYLELGEMSEFATWTQHASQLFDLIGDPVSCNFATSLFCRAAIERLDKEVARSHLDQFQRYMPKSMTRKATAYLLALETELELLSETWEPEESRVAALGQLHAETARFGTSDFLTAVLLDCMCRRGNSEGASRLLNQYLDGYRRERTAIGARLRRSKSQLEVAGEMVRRSRSDD